MTMTPEQHEKKRLTQRDRDLAICFDPADPRRFWRFHLYGPPQPAGPVDRVICEVCDDEQLVFPK